MDAEPVHDDTCLLDILEVLLSDVEQELEEKLINNRIVN